uniref:uncharacterized protein n=1 Tax=Centroberyx gerrardi TaxID=166262 RepID=UPI003AAD83BB
MVMLPAHVEILYKSKDDGPDPPSLRTAATPGPSTAATPGPSTAVTPSPSTAVTPSPSTAVTPSPSTAVTPSPSTAVTPSPSTAVTPSPSTAVTPVPSTAVTPSPSTAVTPSPSTAVTPSPSTAATPSPSTAATGDPSTAATGDPGSATTDDPGTAATEDLCLSSPCGGGSTCEARFDNFTCLCLPGQIYKAGRCDNAKVFPGSLNLPEIVYVDKMGDKTSQEFLDESKSITAAKACDEKTAKCKPGHGSFTCECLDDYVKSDYSDRICMACPSGEKAEGGNCVACPFGYSGLNCNESWKLILVILGSVLGGLLLITLILLAVVAFKPSKSSKKRSKKSPDANIATPYVSHSPAKAPLVSNGSANGQAAHVNAGVPRIPRASAGNSWDRSSNLEMTPSGSRQNLVPMGKNSRIYDDPDDMRNGGPYAQNRAQNNPYAQNRAQTNPYGQNRADTNPYGQNRADTNPYSQNRAQTNPYAQNRAQTSPYPPGRGQTNPYYTHDDGRRLN